MNNNPKWNSSLKKGKTRHLILGKKVDAKRF